MSTTLQAIRQRVGLNGFCGDTLVSATTSLGTTTTLVDSALKQQDDFFNYGSVLFLTGTNANHVRYITDWDQATSTATLDRALPAAVASSVTYELHRTWHPYDKNNAVNEAIRAAGQRWLRRVEDTSLTLDTDTYTYDLTPLTVEVEPNLGLDRVLYDTGITGTGYPYAEIDASFQLMRNSSGTLTLQILSPIPRDAATLRLVYRVRPAQLDADSDLLMPQEEGFYNYVCAKAAAVLFRQRAYKEPESSWTERAQQMDLMADSFFDVEKQLGAIRPARSEILMWGK